MHPNVRAELQDLFRALPAGWEVDVDASGCLYYIDHNTQRTQRRAPWLGVERPAPAAGVACGPGLRSRASAATARRRTPPPPVSSCCAELDDSGFGDQDDRPASEAADEPALPEGWERVAGDGAARPYYVHAAARRVTWADPRRFPELLDLPPHIDIDEDEFGPFYINHRTTRTTRHWTPAFGAQDCVVVDLSGSVPGHSRGGPAASCPAVTIDVDQVLSDHGSAALAKTTGQQHEWCSSVQAFFRKLHELASPSRLRQLLSAVVAAALGPRHRKS